MTDAIQRKRIYSLDILRGLVMVLMALDHTRDFFHYDAFLHNALNLETTSPGLFFTRWITHYCAPIFIFLAGISIYLQSLRMDKKILGIFLFKRGIWLILIEIFVVSFLWTFDYHFKVMILQVIWAIGICMAFMGFLIQLPKKYMLAIGLLIVLGHNIMDFLPENFGGALYNLSFHGNFSSIQFLENHRFVVIYPFIPWLGLMILGYFLGQIYQASFPVFQRRKILLWSGFACILLFILLRFLDFYGNPRPWHWQQNGLYTFMDFINVSKYPPSLHFMLMTIGPALIFLALVEKISGKTFGMIQTFGRVPFFYYLLHLAVIHLICMLLFLFRGHAFLEITPEIHGIPFKFLMVGEGYSLGVVYIIWISFVILLYPICRAYDQLKSSKKFPWLRFL